MKIHGSGEFIELFFYRKMHEICLQRYGPSLRPVVHGSMQLH
jgi:hypothetical protein